MNILHLVLLVWLGVNLILFSLFGAAVLCCLLKPVWARVCASVRSQPSSS